MTTAFWLWTAASGGAFAGFLLAAMVRPGSAPDADDDAPLSDKEITMMILDHFEGPDTEMAIAEGIVAARDSGQITDRYPYDAALTVISHLARHSLRVRRAMPTTKTMEPTP